MAKKKTQYPKRKGNIIKGCIAMACVAVIAGGAITGAVLWNNYQKTWVMNFDGQKITAEELRYFVDDIAINYSSQTQDPVADGYAALKQYLLIERAAKDEGIARTEDDLNTARDLIPTYKSYLESYYAPIPDLDDDELTRLLSTSAVGQPLVDIYSKDYTVNEADFTAAFDDYYTNQRLDWTDVDLKYVYSSDEDTINEALQFVEVGGAFDEAIAKFSEGYSEEDGAQTVKLNQIGLGDETNDDILSMSAGDMTGVVSVGTDDSPAYVILQVETITIPTEDEARATYRESFEYNGKMQMFTDRLAAYEETVKITRNDKGYNAFELYPSSN